MKLYKRKPDDRAPLGQPDPYMIKAGDGRYYIYATGNPGPSYFAATACLTAGNTRAAAWKRRGRRIAGRPA